MFIHLSTPKVLHYIIITIISKLTSQQSRNKVKALIEFISSQDADENHECSLSKAYGANRSTWLRAHMLWGMQEKNSREEKLPYKY